MELLRRKKTLDMIISNYIKDITLMDERVFKYIKNGYISNAFFR